MQKYKLNGWHRIVIAATALWVVVGGLFINNAVINQRAALPVSLLKACNYHLAESMNNNKYASCGKEFDKAWEIAFSGHISEVITATLTPIPLFWLFIYAAIWIYRWVKSGYIN